MGRDGALRSFAPIARIAPAVLVVLAGAPVLLTAEPAAAATITVNDTGDAPDFDAGSGVCETALGNGVCTLRAAIQTANAAPGADDITVPALGVVMNTVGASNDFDITDDLTITGQGQSVTSIDASGVATGHRIFDVSADVTLSAAGMTIGSGMVSGETGGAIRNAGTLVLGDVTVGSSESDDKGGNIANSGTLTMTSSLVGEGVASSDGGGIYNAAGATMTLDGVQLLANEAGDLGGAVWNEGTATIDNSVIGDQDPALGNTAAGMGGGISNAGTMTVRDTRILGNTVAVAGGGGLISFAGGSTLTLERVTVSGNTAAGMGGGVALGGGTVTASDLMVAGNVGGLGAGVYSGEGQPGESPAFTLTRATLSANTATDSGGGIAFNGGTAGLTNVTFAENDAPSGAAVSVSAGANTLSFATIATNATAAAIRVEGGALEIAASLLADNAVANCDMGGTLTSGGDNVATDASCALAGSNDAQNARSPMIPDLLAPIADNGGAVAGMGTFALLFDNPALGNVGATLCATVPVDERGVARPASGCSAGAYQNDGPPPSPTTPTTVAPATTAPATGGARGISGQLPATGRSTPWLALLGLASLAGGFTLRRAARRRHASAAIASQR